MIRRTLLTGVCLLGALSSLPLRAEDDRDDDRDGDRGGRRAVYTMTNDSAANSVNVFRRLAGGKLSLAGTFATGGKGSGGGLGSQGSLVLHESHSWLLAVNAGSDDISVFHLSDSGITLSSRTLSGGHMPISVTISGRIVYVLNANAPSNIAGFTLEDDGSLTPIPNSIRLLSTASAGPAQVQFSPDGDQIMVTEKATNLIDVFPIGPDGIPDAILTTPSHGLTPFGFAFGKRNRVFVSEAFGGAANASAASSYNLDDSDMLQLISGSVPTNQTAACWLVVDPSGRFAYTTNTGSRTVSLFRIGKGGTLTLISTAGSTPAGGPIDAAFSGGGRFLHVLTANAATIVTFRVQRDGALMLVSTTAAPAKAAGLAAE